jgi:hypothetical protein
LRPRTTLLESQLDRVERLIRDQSVEHAFAFTADGKLLLHKTDDAISRVAFMDAEIALLPGATLTHNHPGGRSISETDVTFAMDVELAEIRVVTTKRRFILLPPAEGWSRLVRHALPAVLKIERHLLQRQVFREIDSGVTSHQEADLTFHHLLWQRMSRRGLVRYRAEPW